MTIVFKNFVNLKCSQKLKCSQCVLCYEMISGSDGFMTGSGQSSHTVFSRVAKLSQGKKWREVSLKMVLSGWQVGSGTSLLALWICCQVRQEKKKRGESFYYG